MLQTIISIICVISFLGMAIILARKVPALASLPYNGTTGIRKHRIIKEAEAKLIAAFAYFEKQILLHKIVSWIKIIALKVETRADHMLRGLRKKAQEADKKSKI